MKVTSLLVLPVLLLVCIILRLLVLNAPAVYYGMPCRITPDPEEMRTGTIGWDILTGPLMPSLWNYRLPPRDGGNLITGIITIPFLAAFGPTYFSLKLAGLALFLAGLAIMYHFLRENFNSRTAIIACLLYIFCPPGPIFYEYFVHGTYYQAFAIQALILLILFKVCFPIPGSMRKTNAALLGCVSALGLFWHPHLVVMVALCVLALLLFRYRIFATVEFPLAAISFLVFLIPSISAYHVLYSYGIGHAGWASFLSPGYFHNALTKARDLTLKDPAMMNYYEGVLAGGIILNYIYYLFFICGIFFLSWRVFTPFVIGSENASRSARKIRTLLLFIPLFYIFYCFSNMADHTNLGRYRFIMPYYRMIPPLIAIFADQVIRKFPWHGKVTMHSLLLFFLGLGLLSSVLLSLPGEGNLKSISVNTYENLGGYIAAWYAGDLNEGLRLIARAKRGLEREDALMGALRYFRRWPGEKSSFGAFLAQARGLDDAFTPYYFRELGNRTADLCGHDMNKINAFLNDAPEPAKSYCYEGVGSNLAYCMVARFEGFYPEKVMAFNSEIAKVDERSRPACYRGFGAAVIWDFKPIAHYGMRMGRNPARFKAVLSLVPELYRSNCLEGIKLGHLRFPYY